MDVKWIELTETCVQGRDFVLSEMKFSVVVREKGTFVLLLPER
jgi:hypothetical protein